MAVSDFKSIGPVPIVGQSVEVYAIRPIIVARCKCGHPDAKTFTILYPEEIVTCHGCGARYFLRDLRFTNNNGEISGSCNVGKLLPAPRLDSAPATGSN